MTNPERPGPESDDQEHGDDVLGDVLAVREKTTVTTRLKSTTCAWCGDEILYAGVGRPPKYCSDSHRQRAFEVRTAQRRADRPVDEGGRTTKPVREIVERTETVTRTTVRRGPAKVRLPEDIYEWQGALRHLQDQVRAGHFVAFGELLVRDLGATAAVVREHEESMRQRLAERVPAPRPRPQGSKKKRRKRR